MWAGWVGLARKANAGRSRRKTLMTDILEETKVGDKLCMLERRTDADKWPIQQHHIDHVANARKKREEAK